MPVTVRPAVTADEADAFRLLAQLFGEERPVTEDQRALFRELCASERGAILVAVEDGVVLGVITFSYNLAIRYGGIYSQIEELVVDEAARGKQVGAALVLACIATSREHGCKEIGLYPREGNRPFYEKYGFTYAGVELRQPLV